MLCTNCGARLMESDQFCPKCGAKAIKDSRCLDCGAVLRDGAKFCPKCGRSVGGSGGVRGSSVDDTLDIPIDAIERNILSETAAEIKAERRNSGAPRKSAQRSASTRSASSQGSSERGGSPRNSSSHGSSGRSETSRSSSSHSPSERSAPAKRREPVPEPPRKKRVVYREEDWEDDDWDEDDWEDDEEDEGVDVITIMTAVIGCVLLVVVAVLGFNLFRQYVPKDYDKVAEEEQEQEEQEEQGQEQTSQDGENLTAGDGRETYTLTITHNVNVRDQPGTHGTNVLRVAKEGETYTSYGALEGGEWYEILLEDGTTGYVFYEYISIE